jgi:hypothetical protein
MSEEKRKPFGRVKGQTKSQSIISDELIAPYEIQIDDYSFTVVDATKPTSGFCGSFTTLSGAVDKIVQYKIASKRETYSLSNFINDYKETKNNIKQLLEI